MLSMYTVAVYVYCSFVHIIVLPTTANIHANEKSKVAGIILSAKHMEHIYDIMQNV